MLAARSDNEWHLLSGSLLTGPKHVVTASWGHWRDEQPTSRTPTPREDGFDLGPGFEVQPFKDLLAVRRLVSNNDWSRVASDLGTGVIHTVTCACRANFSRWSPPLLLARQGQTDAHHVVSGAQRPVWGMAATTGQHKTPHSEARWAWQLPPHVPRGPDLGAMARHRHLFQWPAKLLGIDWLGEDEHGPPAAFVVGRLISRAWIVDVVPEFESGELRIVLGWDAAEIDPLGCTIDVRAELNGLPVISQHFRVSDLPHNAEPSAMGAEPRTLTWRERTVSVRLPRGPRRTAWGMVLRASDGTLLDERPVAQRVEAISFAIRIGDSAQPASEFTVGDQQPPPLDKEILEAKRAAEQLFTEANAAAAQRRTSTAGDLERYLRWRFSCRDGELLVLDPYLLNQGDASTTIAFLSAFGRPVRALCKSIPSSFISELALAGIDARVLPQGSSTLHDRVWLVGETGLLVGGSINTFVGPGRKPATTVTEMPWADAALWRDQFEKWWPDTP